MTTFRTKPVLLSPAVFEACRALSEIGGHDCVDAFVDLRLGLLLSTEADIKWLTDERRKRMAALRDEYKARIEEAFRNAAIAATGEQKEGK